MKKILALISAVGLGLMLLTPVFAADGKGVNLKPETPEEWRTYLQFRRDETLERLYEMKPEAEQVVKKAEGYAVFSNFGLKVLFVGGGSGRGILHDNKTRKETFMRMVEAGAGFGLGVKDFRTVFVFEDRDVMEKFMIGNWSVGGQADASARSDQEIGGDLSGAVVVAPGVRAYQMTENGLALEAMVQGTKYWVDKEVNE